MALKIEFSSSFKDAQLVESQIKSLQKQLVDLGKTGANASNEVNKSMQGIANALTKMQELSKGAGSLKEITNQIDHLAKLGTNVQAFARSFDALGKSINTGIGESALRSFGNLKTMIGDVSKSIDEYKSKMEEIDYNINLARSRGDTDASATFQAQREATAMSAAQMEEMRAKMQWQAAMARPWGDDPSSFMGRMNWGRAAGMFRTGAMATYGAGEAAWQFGTMGMRSDIAQRRLRMQIGEEALSGDPTLAILKDLGAGVEHGGLSAAKGGAYGAEWGKELLKYAGIAAATVMTGGLGGLAAVGTLAATTGFRGAGEINADATARMRNLDKDFWEKSFAPSYQAYRTSYGHFEDLYRMRGDSNTNNTIAALMAGSNGRLGMNYDQLAVGVNAANYYGLALTGTGAEQDLLGLRRSYGISDYGQQQSMRLARARGDATAIQYGLTQMLGGSAAGTDINARRILSDAAFRNLEGMGNMSDIAQSGALIQSTSQGVAATGMYTSGMGGLNAEGAQVAVQAAQGIQSQMANPVNVVHAMYDMKLISLGVTEVGVRQMLLSVMARAGVTAQIIRTIQNIRAQSGKPAMSEADIRAELSGTGKAITDTRARAFGVNSRQAKIAAEQGMDVGGWMMGGAEGSVSGLYQASQAGLQDFGKLPFLGEGAKAYAPTGMDTIRGAEGKAEAAKLGAFESLSQTYTQDLYRSIYSAIGDALQTTGKEIADKVRDAAKGEPDVTDGGDPLSSLIARGANKLINAYRGPKSK